ncbi:hypothetical protein VKT23_009592 [Stygiomarasmius scandens]|uniref:Carboxylesterase type B domain-containing protein n=1 Tax=Marasmiellus scandens TaxID=2682957 RepID=A0ABR1JF03_9AGAR
MASQSVQVTLWSRKISELVCLISVFLIVARACHGQQVVQTTSGRMQGVEEDGVVSFKGIRYALAPVETLRWGIPTPYIVDDTVTNVTNATTFGNTCIQQFYPVEMAEGIKQLLNNPENPPVEGEDCLFL